MGLKERGGNNFYDLIIAVCLSLEDFTKNLTLVVSYMKFFLALLIFASLFGFGTIPGEAATCKNLDGHQICIIQIKRSAKNYWEYRAIVSIDNRKRPMEVYNCRDKYTIEYDKAIIPFKENSPGELICSLFDK